MLRSSITGIVDLCVRRAWRVIIVALVLALGAGDYAVRHFAIHTDVNDQVAQTRTLSSLIPDDQDEKLALIHTAATAISPSLNPGEIESPPTDKDEVDVLSSTADSLAKVAADKPGRGAEAARRLSGSSMGELMALALVCTMMAAVLFQPALMGPPRQKP
jgi:hypothetical protein